jgi:ribosome-associated protein
MRISKVVAGVFNHPAKGEAPIATKTTTKSKTAKSKTVNSKLSRLERLVSDSLDSHKAENIVSVDLTGKSDFADRMIIASGSSARHIAALADYVVEALRSNGATYTQVEGKESGDWVLVDAGNIIIHIFRPEIRTYYNLEKMWSVSLPQQELEAAY